MAVPDSATPHDCGALFGRHLPHILRTLNLWPTLGIVALTLLDTYLVSYLGQVAGLFYQAFINQDAPLFRQSILYAIALYVAATFLAASTKALGDYLALLWRTSLAARLHHLYCRHLGKPAAAKCDTPEQRISADVQQLTAAMADAARALAAAPFQAVLYSVLTARAFGSWLPCGAALLFFLLGAALQRVLMGPVARRVFSQEAREGALRAALHRASGHALEIALWGGQPVEQAHLEACFQAAASNQLALLLRVWALTCSTKMLEYLGALLNYLCLGLAIFTGLGGHQFPTDPGQRAGAVSNASFFLITLLYSFTQLLDAATTASQVAGLAARVSQLLQVLEAADAASTGDGAPAPPGARPASGSPGSRRATADAPAGAEDAGQGRDPHLEPLLKGWGGGGIGPAVEGSQGLLEGAKGGAGGRGQAVVLLADGGIPLGCPGVAEGAAEGPSGLQGGGAGAGAAPGDAPGSSSKPPAREQAGGRASPVAHMLQPPTCQPLVGGRRIEVSVHAVRAADLRRNLSLVFPDAPTTSPLLAAVTFQLPPAPPSAAPDQPWHPDSDSTGSDSTSGGSDQGAQETNTSSSQSESSTTSCSSEFGGSDQGAPGGPAGWQREMDAMLRVFLEWQAAVCEALTEAGHWSDAVDPRTGRAMRGRAGVMYSEVLGAQVFLGYEREGSRACPLVRHPECGRWCYPATLFTSAPAPLLRAAIAAAHARCSRPAAPGPPPMPQHHGTVLAVREAEVHTPGQQLVAACLTVELREGGMLLLTGPSGCGKSTLVACLAGLQPLAGGDMWILPRGQVMFVPQHPLPAPGATLAHQLAYPHPDPPPLAQCRQLLQAACLPHLLPHLEAEAPGEPRDWASSLSPGELQRLQVARLLLHRPALAVLDEAFSGVGPEVEGSLLETLAAQGTAVLLVTHRVCNPSRPQAARLHLLGDGSGGWLLT